MFSKLEQRIQEQAQKYYTSGTQDVTDEEFDDMVEQLRKENPNSNMLKTGWGYDVTADSTPGEKVVHKYGEVGSLEKCRTAKEIGSNLQDKPIWTSLKLDGISVVLYYQQGMLVQALTRGDGHTGIDITAKVQYIVDSKQIELNSSPLTVDDSGQKFTGAVRGEIIMLKDNFRVFQGHHPDAKNPRNSTAGLINSKELSEDLKYLDLIVYTVVGDETASRHFENMSKVVEWLHSNFYCVAPYHAEILRLDTCVQCMNALKATWETDELGKRCPSDGIVITDDTIHYDMHTHEISYTAKAFKFPSEIRRSKVVEVAWNMSKTRYAIPLIHIEPIQLAGTKVSKVTGYNAKYIADNHIGPGAVIEIEKRGEIIPNINNVISPGESYEIPHSCPECGTALEYRGVHLQCVNPLCKNAAVQDLLCWLQHLAPLDNFGDNLKIKFLSEIYGEDNLSVEAVMDGTLDPYMNVNSETPAQRRLFAEMVKKLYTSRYSLVDALLALNIPRIGTITASAIASETSILKELYTLALQGGSENVDEMKRRHWSSALRGEANVESMLANLSKFRRWKFIEDRIIWKTASKELVKVAVTGKLSVKRAKFEEELSKIGYVIGELSKDTKFLITDNPNSSSSKNKKADQWGITKISEAEFRGRYM